MKSAMSLFHNEVVIALSATFTADSLKDPLEYWLRELSFPGDVEFAPYNQVFQSLLDSSSLLAQNRKGINVLLVRFEDWAADLESNIGQFLEALRAAAGWPSPLIVAVCPASPHFDPSMQA